MLPGKQAIAVFAVVAITAVIVPVAFASSASSRPRTATQTRTAERAKGTHLAAPTSSTSGWLRGSIFRPDVFAQGCYDTTVSSGSVYSSPGPGPGFSNRVIGNPPAGLQIDLTCYYYNNVGQGRYYAETPVYEFANNQHGYIWVQRLQHGRYHRCQSQYGGADGGAIAAIGSSDCPLTNVN